MKKWFAVFKTGTHTNSKGVVKEYGTADLDKIVETYNPAEFEAPIVVGHPKTDSPAYGWIEKVKRIGEVLYALPKQVVQEFSDAVKQGLYKNRSVSLNQDGSLRHVGFLGAAPPAVKGLPAVEFKEDENEFSIEFESHEADIEDPPAETKEEPDAEKGNLLSKIAELEANLSDAESNYAELVGKNEVSLSKEDKANAELGRLRLVIRKTEFEQFLNEQIAYGNLLPAHLESTEKILEALSAVEFTDKEDSNVFEFSDGTAANPVELFKEFIKGLPKIIEFSETATGKPTNVPPVSLSATQSAAEEIRKQMSK